MRRRRWAQRHEPEPSGGGPELAPRESCACLPLLMLLLWPRPRPCPQPFHCDGRGNPCKSVKLMRSNRIADSRFSAARTLATCSSPLSHAAPADVHLEVGSSASSL